MRYTSYYGYYDPFYDPYYPYASAYPHARIFVSINLSRVSPSGALAPGVSTQAYPPSAYPPSAYPPASTQPGYPQSGYPPQGSISPSQPNTGGISFEIQPSDAQVYVDGQYVWDRRAVHIKVAAAGG